MADANVRIGDIVGPYTIEALIGVGGMAAVYRAQHAHLKRSVALKVPSGELAAELGFRERFISEARNAASIEHPHLVTVFDFGEADGRLYLAMQYVGGGDLRTLLREEGRLGPERAADYFTQIAGALDAAHDRGLVHRDVKPGNVLIDDGHCYVTDFGISKLSDASQGLTVDGQFLGTFSYAAPEQINGDAVDRRTDVYALGCVAFEALTGSVPFPRDSAAAVLYAHMMTPPPRASTRCPELPRAVDEVISRALSKQPGERQATAGTFAAELETALTGGTVTARVEAPKLPRPLQAVDSAFVGRAGELETLHSAWDAAAAGACVAVGLAGEGGIGKTRLAGELARSVHEAGALVFYGRCDDGLAVPYQPFMEALRPLPRALGLERVQRELSGLAPELRRLWPELSELGHPQRSDPESERFALFEAVTALLELASREHPLLVVLDDLHWASEPTLMLLRHTLSSERAIRALVLGTFRDTEVERGRPLSLMLGDLARRGVGQRVAIGGLEEDAIAQLLHASGCPDEARRLVGELESQTGGNPFFMREVIAHLVETGGIATGRIEAPEGLREVIAHRVARLSEPTQRMLTVAAVAGPSFSLGLLERALGREDELLDEIDEGVGAGLLTETGPDEFTFAHALVRQTIYDDLGSTRRMRLHRRLGEALETLGSPTANAEALSHHFALAAADGQAAKAAEYALLAGLRATERLGFEEAVRHYERGLAAIGDDDPEGRCELLLALGDARWNTAEPELAHRAFGAALELAEALGDPERLACAALGISGPQFFLLDQSQAVTLKRALDALGDEDSGLRAEVLARLAASFMPGADALARDAVLMARRVGDKEALAKVLSVVRLVDRGPDGQREALEEALELGRVAEEIGDVQARANAHEFLLTVKLEDGEMDAVEAEFAALERIASAPSAPRYVRGLLAALGARRAYIAGRLEESEGLAHDALVFAGTPEGATSVPTLAYMLQMLYVRAEQDRMGELIGPLEAMAAKAPPMPVWHSTLAYAYAVAGLREQAQAEVAKLEPFTSIPRDSLWMMCVSQLADAVALTGDLAHAGSLYELMEPFAQRVLIFSTVLCFGAAGRPLGLLAVTLGRFEDAERHFEAALRLNTHIRSPLFVARTQVPYARLLDEDAAAELRREARATADALGLVALARELSLDR